MTPIQIVETTLRDGLQNEATLLDTGQKVALAEQLLAFGATRLEVTSFVNPKRVPQMADADALMDLLRDCDASLSALVVNQRGLQRALDARVDEVNIVIVATDTFCQRNQGMTAAEALEAAAGMVAAARAAEVFATVTIGAAFGCPFEGEVSVDTLREVVVRVAESQPDELALADTIGVAVPTDIAEKVTMAREIVGPALPMRLHLHDTRHTGVANAVAGYQAGVSIFDATSGGVGGCPFAPRATGNVATEDLVYLFERMGLATGLDLDGVRSTAEWLEDALGKQLPGALLRAGVFPPAE